jgi:hypothetical protein
LKRVAVPLACLTLAGCASLDRACPAGHDGMRRVDLYFGRNIGQTAGVSEQEFAAFVEQEVSPRFPDGLTIADVQGRWRGQDGKIVREPSKVITLIVEKSDGAQQKIDAIRHASVAKFKQDAVMEISARVCVGL